MIERSEIEHRSSANKGGAGGCRIPVQQGTNPGEDFGQVKGFGHVIVAAIVQVTHAKANRMTRQAIGFCDQITRGRAEREGEQDGQAVPCLTVAGVNAVNPKRILARVPTGKGGRQRSIFKSLSYSQAMNKPTASKPSSTSQDVFHAVSRDEKRRKRFLSSFLFDLFYGAILILQSSILTLAPPLGVKLDSLVGAAEPT